MTFLTRVNDTNHALIVLMGCTYVPVLKMELKKIKVHSKCILMLEVFLFTCN